MEPIVLTYILITINLAVFTVLGFLVGRRFERFLTNRLIEQDATLRGKVLTLVRSMLG